MKIVVYPCTTFIGANLCNYFVQHSKHDIIGIAKWKAGCRIPQLEPSIQSRSRFELHWMELSDSDAEIKRNIQIIHQYLKPDIFLWTGEEHIDEYHIGLINENAKVLHIRGVADPIYSGVSEIVTPSVFGPRQSCKGNTVAAKITKMLQGQSASSDSEFEREWIYVKDLYHIVDAGINSLMTTDSIKIEAHTGFVASESSLVRGCAKIIDGVNVFVEDVDFRRTESNFQVKYPLDSAIEHTISWYSANMWITEV